jgi:hypothetical protein
MRARRLLTDITEEEARFGFVVEVSGARNVAVAHIGRGLRAIKVAGHGGQTSYLVCDERLCPLYCEAISLTELRVRFPS